MEKTTCFILFLLLLVGCSSTKYRGLNQRIDKKFESNRYNDRFVGLLLIDPQTGDTLYHRNSKKYFTPASNTKIFTLYAALKMLPKHIPALKYTIFKDTLFMEGTGDPSLLHPYFKDSTAIHFLKGFKNIALYPHNFQEEKFGPGWAWDDYHYDYSPERSSIPLYGNVVTMHQNDSLTVFPDYFKDQVIPIGYTVNREINRNIFYFDPLRKDTLGVPFITDSTLTRKLLEDLIKRKVTVTDAMPRGEKKTLFGIASDSLYRRMMHESDNFLAEQLLILASSTLSDTLNSLKVRDYVLKNFLTDLRQPPRWVDGSGLSRYNLFSPESMVNVLHRMYRELPKERLFALFPAWEASDPLKNPGTRIYAKSGSLSNNYCLSGYLLTKSGKTFIFSFMNNHFKNPSSEIKEEMQAIFEWIHDTY